MNSSRVRIEFVEEGNHFAREAGSIDKIDVGMDLRYAVGVMPRPMLVLVQAIATMYRDYPPMSDNGKALEKAANTMIREWQRYDDMKKTPEEAISHFPKW